MKLLFAAAAALCLAAPLGAQELTPSHPDAKVYFVNLMDGDTVTSPVTVIFGLSSMGISPAGLEKENTGHHHLLIDRPAIGKGEDGADEMLYGLPADEHHVHFGGGQTETVIELSPGRHTLQLVLGDASHVPHETPVVSKVITINVE